MITGNDSWKYLVLFFIVMAIMGPAGGIAMAYGKAGIFFGIANIALGLFYCYHTYKKAEKEQKEAEKKEQEAKKTMKKK